MLVVIWLLRAIWWIKKTNSLLKGDRMHRLLKSVEISLWLWTKHKVSSILATRKAGSSLSSQCLPPVLSWKQSPPCYLLQFSNLHIKEGHSCWFIYDFTKFKAVTFYFKILISNLFFPRKLPTGSNRSTFCQPFESFFVL